MSDRELWLFMNITIRTWMNGRLGCHSSRAWLRRQQNTQYFLHGCYRHRGWPERRSYFHRSVVGSCLCDRGILLHLWSGVSRLEFWLQCTRVDLFVSGVWYFHATSSDVLSWLWPPLKRRVFHRLDLTWGAKSYTSVKIVHLRIVCCSADLTLGSFLFGGYII